MAVYPQSIIHRKDHPPISEFDSVSPGAANDVVDPVTSLFLWGSEKSGSCKLSWVDGVPGLTLINRHECPHYRLVHQSLEHSGHETFELRPDTSELQQPLRRLD